MHLTFKPAFWTPEKGCSGCHYYATVDGKDIVLCVGFDPCIMLHDGKEDGDYSSYPLCLVKDGKLSIHIGIKYEVKLLEEVDTSMGEKPKQSPPAIELSCCTYKLTLYPRERYLER